MGRTKTPLLSVVLATHNEAANLKQCLEPIRDLADEIIVVDGASTDQTVFMAKKLGAKVIETTNKPIFHINKQMAMDAAKGKWVLQLDADEVVDGTLKASLKAILSKDAAYNAFYLKRKNYFLGRFLRKGGQYPDPVIRFYRRGKAYLPQKDVHEQMEVAGEVGTLAGHLLHYNAPNFKRYLTNANRYTTLTAQRMYEAKIKMTLFNDLIYLGWKPMLTFLKLYVRHRGYQDGFPGLVFALFSGLHYTLAYMKLGDRYRHENSH